MKNICIIGNSFSSVKAAQSLREKLSDSQIHLFPMEQHLPYDRTRLWQLINQDCSFKELSYQEAAFYEELKVQVHTDQKIQKINTHRQYVTTEDKQKFLYDFLLIADTGAVQWPEVKGVQKSGVFHLRTAADASSFLKHLSLSETVCLQSNRLLGFKIAVALRNKGKDVVWLTGSTGLREEYYPNAERENLKRDLEEKGIRLLEGECIAEILGDFDVKAVRLQSGKVLAAQTILFPDAGPQLRIFKETEIVVENGVRLDAFYQTSVAQVYGFDRLSSESVLSEGTDHFSEVLEKQVQVICQHILGKTQPTEPESASSASSALDDSSKVTHLV